MEHITSKWDELLAIHSFSELKSLANNAKFVYLLKFYLYSIFKFVIWFLTHGLSVTDLALVWSIVNELIGCYTCFHSS